MTIPCGCCGATVTSTDSIDYSLHLPDVLIGVPDAEIVRPTDGILKHADARFVRCLLPVRLTGGVELWIGSWLQVTKYADLTLTGTFANSVPPWDDLLGAPVEAVVRDREYPHFTSHPLLDRDWDRDWALSGIHEPLPIAVHAPSAERCVCTDADDRA